MRRAKALRADPLKSSPNLRSRLPGPHQVVFHFSSDAMTVLINQIGTPE
jgi:hypothetical protein